MANLMFKYGKFTNLPEKIAGQILVTTDEKAMYVDLPNASVAGGVERLRLGQTIVYPTWDAFNKEETLPPSSPEAFYYIEDDNALLKYVGGSKNDDGTWSGGQWKQINSLTDITDRVKNLEDAVAGLNEYKTTSENAIKTLQEADVTLQNNINAEKTRAEAEEARIEGLVTAEVARAEAEEERLGGLIAGLEENKATKEALNGEIDRAKKAEKALQDAIDLINNEDTGLAGRIGDLEETVGDANSGLVKDVADLKNSSATNTKDISKLKTTVGDANSGLVKDVANLKTTVGDANSGLVKDVADLKAKDENLQGQIDAITNGESGLGSRVNALEGQVSTLENDVKTLGEKDIELEKEIDDVADRATALENTVGDSTKGLVKDVADLKTTVGDVNSGLVKDVNALEGQVSSLEENKANKTDVKNTTDALQGEIDALEGIVGNASSGLVKKVNDLETTVGSEVVEGGSLSANINTIKDNISTINESITSLSTNKADKTYVDSQITEKLAEVDGMKFKGAINALVSDEANNKIGLPTTGVEAGWTYIVEDNFVDGEGDSAESYYAGDLIIAKEDQGNAATYTGGWDHVKTGYWKEQDPTLEIADTNADDNQATISLKTIAGTDRGSVNIVGNGVDVAASGGNINITLAWGQFDTE